MREIVWLLDLDGVLNFSGPTTWPTARAFTVEFGGMYFSIRYSPELVTAIQTVAEGFSIDVRLASTWCEEPGPILARLGLRIQPGFPVTVTDDVGGAETKGGAGRRPVRWTADLDR